MAIHISKLPPSTKLQEVAKLVDKDGSGQVTAAEVEAAKALVTADASTFTPALKEALSELEKIVKGERPLPPSTATRTGPRTSPLATRLPGGASIDESASLRRLNSTQKAVLGDVREKAKARSEAAMPELMKLAERNGYSAADVRVALDYIRDRAPLTVNFHPDKALKQQTRASSYGRTPSTSLPEYNVAVDRETSKLVDAFLVDGHYKNQFETGITSGSSTAYPGGSRDRWEETIFEKGYHGHDLVPAERPKYGALNAANNPKGPASQYGSCFFVLKEGARHRTSFTPKNSSGCQAGHVGTIDNFAHVLKDARDFKDIMEVALGKKEHTTGSSWGYLEAQVHGPVEFDTDIAAVVINQKFSGTEYETKLREFAEMNNVEVRWTDQTRFYTDAEWQAKKAGGA